MRELDQLFEDAQGLGKHEAAAACEEAGHAPTATNAASRVHDDGC
jgi:hypothetical protein